MTRKFILIILTLCIFPSEGHTQTHAIDGEFITEWLLLGPFSPAELDKDFLVSAGGEANVHPKEGDSIITATGDTLRWERYRSIGSIIDLDHAVGDYDGVTLYAFCNLQCETKERVQFLLGSNDEVAVWINGRQVHHHRVGREVLADQDLFEAELKAGENRCLVKVTEGGGTWGFALRAYPYDRPVDAVPTVGWWASSLKHRTKAYGWLTPNWKYHPGDNPAWANPDFDDRSWETTNTWFPLNNPPKSGWNGIGWFRLHLAVDSTLWNQTLALNVEHWGASEIYLDGTLFAQFGKVGSSKHDEEGYMTPGGDGIPPPKPIVFDKKTDHVIAVRFSDFLMEDYPHQSQGFEISLIDWDRAMAATAERADFRRKITIHQMLLSGISLAFSLLHLLLFLFYPQARANLYYAAFTAFFGLTIYFWFQTYFATTPVDYAWVFRLLFMVFAFMSLSFVRLTYWLMYPKLPRMFIVFLVVGIGITLWFWLTLSFALNKYLFMLAIAAFAESVRVWVVSMLKKRRTPRDAGEGNWIILLGMIPFALVVVYYALGAVYEDLPFPWSFEDFPAPFYGILLLMISMSVFLSRNFAQTNKNLEAQLIQVKALSEKTIQQEREKAQLEAENARKTKELEEARQLQLSMLPKNPPALPHLDIAADMKPATEVGGDYYDFKVHDDGVLTIAVGDATGHGMQAGTMVAATKSLFNALADEPEPASILQKATKALKEMGYRKMYMALTIAKIQNHQMLVAAAGMPYTLIHRAAGGDVEEVALKAMPLGSFPNFKYEQKKIALEPGDTVLFLSDGLEEMFDPQGEILGAARVKELVAEAGQKPSEQVITHLKNAGKAWANGRAQEDDVTMVVVKVT